MTGDALADLASRIGRLADELAESGDLESPHWREALLAVPRHMFIPDIAYADPNDPSASNQYPVNRKADPQTWWRAVYTDTVLVTQLDDGAGDLATGDGTATSSNSAPGAVFSLLEHLWVQDHQRVLEIGTGTGWTAGLLSHRVGAHNVTSIEIDPALAARARANLQAAGSRPNLVIGDGEDGFKEAAPFDRVHVTCGAETVPAAWVEQTRPGGVLVIPLTLGYGFGHLLRLTCCGDGTATGRFPDDAGYMMLRSQRHLRGPASAFVYNESDADPSWTTLDPRSIIYESRGADLTIAARVPGCQYRTEDTGDGTGSSVFWLFETRTRRGSWASVTYQPGLREFPVRQYGPRRLWDEVRGAYLWWLRAGRPERDKFGMTYSPHGYDIWLGSPERVISGR